MFCPTNARNTINTIFLPNWNNYTQMINFRYLLIQQQPEVIFHLMRFAIREGGRTVGAGQILKILD